MISSPVKVITAFLLGGGIIMLSGPLFAALTVNVTGAVVEGVCEINNGEEIRVDFGNNLQRSQIDGLNFMQTLEYSLNCEALTSNDLEMQFAGTAVSFNEAYLATDKTDLGIKLYMNGDAIPLNTWVPFSWPEIPLLQAAPVRNDVSEPETGAFSASATIKIQYQ